MPPRFRLWLIPVALTLPLLIAGCPIQADLPDTIDDGKDLRRFQSSDELLEYFKTQAIARHQATRATSTGLGALLGGLPNTAEPASADGGATVGDQEAGSGTGDEATSFSTTNLQEVGVDESDVFKSDGAHFYIAKNRSLRIVRATPTDSMVQVGQVDFDHFIDELYLVGNTVLVLGQRWTPEAVATSSDGRVQIDVWPPYRARVELVVTQIDIADPNAPGIIHTNTIDGALVSSRLTNGRLILIMSVVPPMPSNPTPASISGMTLEEIIPRMQRSSAGVEEVVVAAEDWYYPESPGGYYTTMVITLDATNIETVVGSVAVMSECGTIYATPETLYLTDTEYDLAESYRPRTNIHKLAFDDEGVAEYVGSGFVAGRLLNQFSLGEHDDYLRVATHVRDSSWWLGWAETDSVSVESDAAQRSVPPEPFNAVYVLGESDDGLSVVGAVENIAPGERLFAARFLGDRGFLVTFLQVDPLFTLDLSDPNTPTVVGELKIPGFSDYLHPFGEDLLIGVGRSAPGGWARAAQVSLFDVSDLANPTLIEQIELGDYGSYSDVSWTHKAFTFMPDTGLLLLPVSLTSYPDEGDGETPDTGVWNWRPYHGVICYTVDETGFTELGRLATVEYSESYSGWTQWRRGAVINDDVYAVSEAGVRAANLADLTATTNVVLTPDVYDTLIDSGAEPMDDEPPATP